MVITNKTDSQVNTLPNSFIKEIIQVCIVTHDLDKTVHTLSEKLGIGPFKCWHHTPVSQINTKFRGEKIVSTAKLAIAWVGNMQLEVAQPLEGPSIYNDYLEIHGEGIHHLMLDTGSVSIEQAVERFLSVGCPVVQEGMVNVPVKLGLVNFPRPQFAHNLLCPWYGYLDTEGAIKTTIELLKLPPFTSLKSSSSLGKPDYCIPEGKANINSSLEKSFISQICKIGIVTTDLEQTLRNYVERMAIGNWRVYNLDSSQLSQTKLRGQEANFSLRVAFAYIGNILLELVQPIQGQSIHHELLEKHGEGINYLGVTTEGLSFAQAIDKFAAMGCQVVMAGNLKNTYQFAYLDTEPFTKTTLELVSVAAKTLPEALGHFKPDYYPADSH